MCLLSAAVAFADDTAAPSRENGQEFFEKRIRPLLAENCYQCHGEKKQESGLVLNTAAGIKRGGDRGMAISPGDPDASVLIQAVRYNDDDLKMPPRGKLKDEQIADLVAWIKAGALLPQTDSASAQIVKSNEYDLAERRQHWSYQPIQTPPIPLAGTKPGPRAPQNGAPAHATEADLLPAYKSAKWCNEPIDGFILAGLNNARLSPAPPADKRTLLRRITFDLTGLPPTLDEAAAFLIDPSPDAYERLVDRLLASPRYGERFGRHWLDVVRYSESLGFEFDYDLHNAWRYRDYVIRAFNADLPYNQFVIEHLAGDLVPQPRRHPLDGTNESILATGFYWMHEGKQTPVDIRQDQTDRIDNQLDVIGKAFLAQTIACARCHDHKFDAISTCDYYALAGYLRSSRFQQAFIDPPQPTTAMIEELAAAREGMGAAASVQAAEIWQRQASQAADYLLAVARQRDESDLDAERLKQWTKAIGDESLADPDHPLSAWSQHAKQEPKSIGQAGEVFEEFQAGYVTRWFTTGHAFNNQPCMAGEVVIGNSAARPIARLTGGGADSGVVSGRLQGELRSQSFTINNRFVHFHVAGRNTRINLVIDGYTLIMNPMYGKLTIAPTSDRLVWRSMPVDRWVGHRAFIEVSDNTIPMHGLNPPPSAARMPVGPDGYVALDRIVFSDNANPPAVQSSVSESVLKDVGGDGLPALAAAYQKRILAAIERFRAGKLRAEHDDINLLNWLLENGLLDATAAPTDPSTKTELADFLDHYQALEAAIPSPQRAAAIADGTGEDEHVFLRGNHRTPGERAQRDLPEVLRTVGWDKVAPATAGPPSEERTAGSGRLDLAQRLVDRSNPLLPRVLVNRLWQHHFGEGLVRTPDDFGRMGQPPSHPELLDHLASEFLRADYSMKTATRRMVTSQTYRQASSAPSPNPETRGYSRPNTGLNPLSVDPTNRLLHHMPPRRLEAEAVRDSMLAMSGPLDYRMHEPSVLPHITPYMEGRGKPQSGPLDGEGRRSIYLNARRNFLTPLLLAFDYPVTFTPIGRRGNATIPAQALTLMNDPFVVAQSHRWAQRILHEEPSSAEQRIAALFQSAFARPPTADETASAIDFLQHQSLRHGGGSDDERVWTDLCHVLINVKEFIFIP